MWKDAEDLAPYSTSDLSMVGKYQSFHFILKPMRSCSVLLLLFWSKKYKVRITTMMYILLSCHLQFLSRRTSFCGLTMNQRVISSRLTKSTRHKRISKSYKPPAPLRLKNGSSSLVGLSTGKVLNSSLFLIWGELKEWERTGYKTKGPASIFSFNFTTSTE